MLRYALFGPFCLLALLISTTQVVIAEGPVTQDVQVTVADAGEFTVTLQATAGEGEPTFGEVPLDALSDVDRTITVELRYTDTHTQRSSGDVSLQATTFLPVEAVPPFTGSDQVEFQIPDRYLILTDVGDVTANPTCTGAGAITAATEAKGVSFDGGGPLTIATVAEGCGVGEATQSIDLTLTIPAGVYPTTYVAVLTVETTVSATP